MKARTRIEARKAMIPTTIPAAALTGGGDDLQRLVGAPLENPLDDFRRSRALRAADDE
jgi:hypothetical protein